MNRERDSFSELARSKKPLSNDARELLAELVTAKAANDEHDERPPRSDTASTAASRPPSNPLSTQRSHHSNQPSNGTGITVPSDKGPQKHRKSQSDSLVGHAGSTQAFTSSSENATSSGTDRTNTIDVRFTGAGFQSDRHRVKRLKRYHHLDISSDSEARAHRGTSFSVSFKVNVLTSIARIARRRQTRPKIQYGPPPPPSSRMADVMLVCLALSLLPLVGLIAFGIFSHSVNVNTSTSHHWPFCCTTWRLSAVFMSLIPLGLTILGVLHSHGENPRAARNIFLVGSCALSGYFAFLASTAGLSCTNCLLVLVANLLIMRRIEIMVFLNRGSRRALG